MKNNIATFYIFDNDIMCLCKGVIYTLYLVVHDKAL